MQATPQAIGDGAKSNSCRGKAASRIFRRDPESGAARGRFREYSSFFEGLERHPLFSRGEIAAFPPLREAIARVQAAFAARRLGIFSGSRHLPLDIRHFPTILLPTIVLENGMLNEASRNRASGVSAPSLRGAPSPLRRAQRQPGTARTPDANDFAIPGVNGGFARSSPAWGRACAKSRQGIRHRPAGRTYAATGQSRRQDIRGGLVKPLRNLEPEFRKVMRKAARRMVSQTKRNRSAKVKTGGVRKAKPRAHTERQRRVRGVRGQHDG